MPDEISSPPPKQITTYSVVTKFFGQPDDGLHAGPKHVVVYYVLLLIVILLCSWLYVFIDIHTTALCYAYINTQRCVSQTQQNFIMFIIVLGQHVSILIESSSGPYKIQILI